MRERRNRKADRLPRPERGNWSIRRVDIRSPLARHQGHLARVELEHPERGRVTDMGSALDVMSAAFAAAAHILGCNASIVSLHSCHRRVLADDGHDQAMAAIVIECDGRKRRGTATGQDLIYAGLAAFIAAVGSTGESDDGLLSSGLNSNDDIGLLAARPCQATGVDENGDFWLFASDDPGAAKAITDEFGNEDYQAVRLSLPAGPVS